MMAAAAPTSPNTTPVMVTKCLLIQRASRRNRGARRPMYMPVPNHAGTSSQCFVFQLRQRLHIGGLCIRATEPEAA